MGYDTIAIKERPTQLSEGQKKQIRSSGQVPAVITRPGGAPIEFLADTAQLQSAAHRNGIGGIVMLVDAATSEEHMGMLKDLQWNPVSKEIVHASFQEVKGTQEVNTSVPLMFQGEPAALKDKSGIFNKNTESLEVHAKVKDLPKAVAIDVSGLEIGDVVTAGDLSLPDTVRAVHPEAIVCSLSVAREIVEEEPVVEEAAEPELVGQRGTEEPE
jgi:large subunit ribosomal protein L25